MLGEKECLTGVPVTLCRFIPPAFRSISFLSAVLIFPDRAPPREHVPASFASLSQAV